MRNIILINIFFILFLIGCSSYQTLTKHDLNRFSVEISEMSDDSLLSVYYEIK